MIRIREIPWLRISAEMAAIVVSILLAFWIQAWWEARQQRIEEERVLQSLAVEFARLRVEAEELGTLYSAILDSLVSLVEIGKGTRPRPDPGELDRMFADTVWYETLGAVRASASSSACSAAREASIESNHVACWT